MEESTALWLLGLAHSEYEAVRSELDEADRVSAALARERDELREAHRRMLEERIALRDERDAAHAEAETLRNYLSKARADIVLHTERIAELSAELEALKAKQATGWVTVLGWAYAHPDGRMVCRMLNTWAAGHSAPVRSGTVAKTSDGETPIDAARAAGWLDFPGASDHSAGAP